MKIFRDLDEVPVEYKNAVITLGNFDGLHIGHRAIIAEAKAIATSTKAPLALMTFEPHPREFFARDNGSVGLRIYNLRSKLTAIKSLGIECIFLLRFNNKLTNLSAHDFIKKILVDKLKVRHIVTGENFHFGKNRQGNKELLAHEAASLSFGYTSYAQVLDNGNNTVSSSNIRLLLGNGNVKKAAYLLGQPYHISGRVKHGENRGSRIGFPTANIALNKLFLPRFGVYAVSVQIEGKNENYNAIANLGVKPTFGINAPLLEVHLFDFSENLYGKRLCVEFKEFIREEKKFQSLDELKTQIAIDCEKVKLLGNI